MKKVHVVLLHGLFMSNLVMGFLATSFAKKGYTVSMFQYASRGYSDEVLASLHHLVSSIDPSKNDVILVGHSMGGLIGRRLCQDYPELVKCLITLATPHQQSKVGALAQKFGLIGSAGEAGITVPLATWPGQIPLLSIAGNLKIGLLALDAEPNDGTVRVAETLCENQTAHTVLPVSHTGIVYSKKAVDAAALFIELHRSKTPSQA